MSAPVSPSDRPGPVPPRRRRNDPPDPRLSALSLLDEAFHRLRSAPASTLVIYQAGTLPFLLALLFFWADMSRSADAAERSVGFAAVLAMLFVVMKVAQTVFATRMRAEIAGQRMPAWTGRRLLRVALFQAAWQPTGLFVLSVASAIVLPLGWAYAFYQNLTLYGDGERRAAGRPGPLKQAWQAASADSAQNHRALLLLSLFGTFAWIALLAGFGGAPYFLRLITGEENVFTRNINALFNSTFLAAGLVLVYAGLDPFVKTFYVLRCFYRDAATTGEDLLSDLRALEPVVAGSPSGAAFARPDSSLASLARSAALVLLVFAVSCSSAAAAESSPPSPAPVSSPASVSPQAVEQSMHSVFARREFAWRGPARAAKPPEPPKKEPESWWRRLTRRFFNWLNSGRRDAAPAPDSGDSSGGLGTGGLVVILYALIAILVVAGLALAFRAWQQGAAARVVAANLAPLRAVALPDLTDHDVQPDQLPEDEWLTLARALLERGETRLALRAFYLSALAHLGQNQLIAVARVKSNRDYQREFRRRTHDRPEVQDVFARLIARFERVWYGRDAADPAMLEDFQADRNLLLSHTGNHPPGAPHPSPVMPLAT